MVYGTTLRLLAEYFYDEQTQQNPNIFVKRFREQMRRVRPTDTAHHIKQKTFTHKTLGTCTHVFVRVDRTKKPLESPSEGPYEVIKRLTDRLFQIQIQEKTVNISTEKLKPAFTETHATDEEEPPGHQEVNEAQNTKTSLIKKVQFATQLS